MAAGMKTASVFGPALVVVLCTVLLALPGCKIVRDDQRAKATASTDQAFDAGRYVDGMWNSKVLPFFDAKAVDLVVLSQALHGDADAAGRQWGHRADAEGSPWSYPVKGLGKIVSINKESRAGVVLVEIAPAREEVTLQVGPVVRGTALRDCLPFFSFGDVKNQIEFAQVGRALNEHAVAAIQPSLAGLEVGRTVRFTGAMSVTGPSGSLLVTPIGLEVATGGTP